MSQRPPTRFSSAHDSATVAKTACRRFIHCEYDVPLYKIIIHNIINTLHTTAGWIPIHIRYTTTLIQLYTYPLATIIIIIIIIITITIIMYTKACGCVSKRYRTTNYVYRCTIHRHRIFFYVFYNILL